MRKVTLGILILVAICWAGTAMALHQADTGDMPQGSDKQMHSHMTQHYQDSLFKTTDHGEFSV